MVGVSIFTLLLQFAVQIIVNVLNQHCQVLTQGESPAASSMRSRQSRQRCHLSKRHCQILAVAHCLVLISELSRLLERLGISQTSGLKVQIVVRLQAIFNA